MRFAYADPPYLGCAVKFYGAQAAEYDTVEGHQRLIDLLVSDYPDGWALSMSSTNLRDLLPFCPADARIAAWCKTFCSYKPGVNPAYAWEPVVFYGGRKRERSEMTLRDWLASPIALRKGLRGSKTTAFGRYVLDLLNVQAEDELVDLFPGTGTMADARAQRGFDFAPASHDCLTGGDA